MSDLGGVFFCGLCVSAVVAVVQGFLKHQRTGYRQQVKTGLRPETSMSVFLRKVNTASALFSFKTVTKRHVDSADGP